MQADSLDAVHHGADASSSGAASPRRALCRCGSAAGSRCRRGRRWPCWPAAAWPWDDRPDCGPQRSGAPVHPLGAGEERARNVDWRSASIAAIGPRSRRCTGPGTSAPLGGRGADQHEAACGDQTRLAAENAVRRRRAAADPDARWADLFGPGTGGDVAPATLIHRIRGPPRGYLDFFSREVLATAGQAGWQDYPRTSPRP